MPRALIALGANVGDRHAAFERALMELGNLPSTRVAARSRWRETAPVGGPSSQPTFLNGAALLETSLAPLHLLEAMLAIECACGRLRGVPWGPRTLDLDLLLYDDLVIQGHRLVVPHPWMTCRRFVLEPAAEIAAEMTHPLLGRRVGDVVAHLQRAPRYVAITSGSSFARRALAECVAANFACRLIPDPVAVSEAPATAVMERRRTVVAANLAYPGDRWFISDFWSEMDSLLNVAVELSVAATPPRLLVQLVGGDAAEERARCPVSWTPEVRVLVGPCLRIDAADETAAAELVITAIRGIE